MDKYQEAEQKYNEAIEAAWQQRVAAIKLGAQDYEQTYQTALQVANDEFRQVVGSRPVQATV